jgi:hypothetical protein
VTAIARTYTDVASTALHLVAVAAMSLCAYGLRGNLNRHYDASRRTLDDANIPRPAVARVLTLGHTEWATDILWINATLYYGETLYAHLPARYIDRYASAMIELDPDFRRSYLWAATALLYRTVSATRNDTQRAGEFLRVGVRRFRNDPEMHMQLGFNLAFEQAPLHPRNGSMWRRLRAEGGEHLRFAASSGVGPAWLPLTVTSLLVPEGRERDAILVLCDGLVHTDDAQALSMIEGRLLELLRGHVSDDPLYTGVVELLRIRRRHYPWMPIALSVFVGSPVLDGAVSP